MYYLFSPKHDADKDRVIRVPKKGEWIEKEVLDQENEEGQPVPVLMYCDLQALSFPILTMKRFEEDPLKEIKEAFNVCKNLPEVDVNTPYSRVWLIWESLVKVVDRLEGK